MSTRLASLRERSVAQAARHLPRWRQLRRWGLPGALALGLGALAAWLLIVELPRGRQALAADERHWALAREAAARPPGADERAGQDPMQRFRCAFPPAQDRHRRIEQLLASATVMGLQPRRSDVRDAPAGASGLQRVRVVMPLAGSYESLRRYVDLALRQDASASLDLLRMERAEPSQPELRIELQWSLWMQPEPGGDAGERR